ncbi:PLDc N-terminal domain-containing protein [Psychromonas sp. MME1]|uniref:PLDc N-terminal domain-containing protein n=1 Tax=Psychromonas sp. MME1 TaxID=3231032 RepID=UPI0034E27EA5
MDNLSWTLNWQDNSLYVALYAFLYFSLLILTTLRIILKRRASGITLAWLFLIFVLPLFGMISYFILGELHLGKKRGTSSANWYTV